MGIGDQHVIKALLKFQSNLFFIFSMIFSIFLVKEVGLDSMMVFHFMTSRFQNYTHIANSYTCIYLFMEKSFVNDNGLNTERIETQFRTFIKDEMTSLNFSVNRLCIFGAIVIRSLS